MSLTTAVVPVAPAWAQVASASSPPPWQRLGNADWKGWSGIKAGPDAAANGARLTVPGTATFRYPAGPRGWYGIGFTTENDSTRDWRDYCGLQVDLRVPAGRTLSLTATIRPPVSGGGRSGFLPQSRATVSIVGDGGWQRVMLPLASFDYPKGQSAFLHYIQSLELVARFADGRKGGSLEAVALRCVRLTRAPVVALDTPVRGKAGQPGQTVTYLVTVTNCADTPQSVHLSFERYGWEAMAASIQPDHLSLAPGASGACTVTVRLPQSATLPPGGHETQRLVALAGSGSEAARLDLITARDVARPSILHTAEGWEAVREKVQRYDWARRSQAEDYVRVADAWQVLEAATPEQRAHAPENHPYVFLVSQFDPLQRTAVAWQLTRNKAYAEKVALFLRRLADEKTGYPSTFAANSAGEPQEGENFQKVAIAYDAILDANVLTDADKAAIARTFRLYMKNIETGLTVGNVGNWNTAANTAALFCALSLGDLSAANRYLYGPSGFTDYVTKGIMDDGWWWEGSTSYNFWVASELTQSALVCQPWGIDLLNQEFPADYSPRTIITPWALDPPYGMSFEKWGPNRRNTRSVKQLWDAVPIVADYRGIAFGMNDGHEEAVGDSRLELGYYAFRDPVYAAILKQGAKRDLIYGVPDLPADTPKPYLNSGFAENLGFALLRSQAENRPPREQILAVFKIGTQGGYHGHFDRVSLDSLMRYGRSFWCPETIWWGYANFMYKFYVQTSVAHNMVVVDQKQQEAVPSTQPLFFSGKMMQAVMQQTDARWSDPPYGGMQYDGRETFAQRSRLNRQSVPPVTDRRWGELGPFSDRVVQRRLGIVTDDYVVIADYLKGSQPHTFDNLFQMKAFAGLEGEKKRFLRHDAQFNPDPHSSAQFITDCDWYQVAAPAVARFSFPFGQGADNAGTRVDHSEDGVLKIDVHTLWPREPQVMLAMPPETHDEQQWVTYSVTGDGKTLAQGESGVWILGQRDVDVPVAGLNELTLNVTTDGKGKKNALFWANARLVTADGKEVPLTIVAPGENVARRPKVGRDYYGGPIKIAGVPYADAIPAQPADAKAPASIRIPLALTGAVRFKATLGGDFPFGDEAQRRRVYAIRSQGTEARFLTVLEPYEGMAMVRSAAATGPNVLRVELADGRVQEITVAGLDASDASAVRISITESRGGKIVRQETTQP